MRKLILIIIVLQSFLFKNVQAIEGIHSNKSKIFLNELNLFVHYYDSVSAIYSGDGRKYIVFVANIYYSDTINKNFCFTLGYILNSNEYNNIKAQYYMDFGSDLVLIKFGNGFKREDLKELDLKVIRTKTEFASVEKQVEIIRRLFPSELDGFTYTSYGLTYWNDGKQNKKIFYDNSDEIPRQISIWGQVPSGYVVKLLREGNSKNQPQLKLTPTK